MERTIRKVLIANRGEITRRIMRTCRRLGIDTVAVFSDADATMPFVREADEAVRLGPAESAQSYLKVDAVLAAAARTGACAIHPGYGFLAENADFARAVEAAGCIFVGPSPEVIEQMGTKREAKRIAEDAGVPTVPGYDGSDPSVEAFAREAERIGYPVLLKASAGGGGKGMKRVDAPTGLEAALESARREAKKAFGDDTMLLEKYLEAPRHIEVQILGDAHGQVMHLGERECSVQRRHQKVLEESPAPNLPPALRTALCDAAVRLGQSIGYQNAGTVEFIVSGDDYYFLEVNTRLQVEHPVTEEVYRVDLVAAQLAVARGVPLAQLEGFEGETGSLTPRGHAIEARLYAEDEDYLPQTGTVVDWHFASQEGLRVEAAVETGSEIGVHYDPMLAKVIAYGANRQVALDRLHAALRRASVLGITTNRALLLSVLESPAFVEGRLHTQLLAEGVAKRLSQHDMLALAVATAYERAMAQEGQGNWSAIPAGFGNNPRPAPAEHWTLDGASFSVQAMARRGCERISVTAEDGAVHTWGVRVLSSADESATFDVDGHRFTARLWVDEEAAYVSLLGENVAARRQPRFPLQGTEEVPGALVAPMPGKVVMVDVAEGDVVTRGQRLLVLEAMKMEHEVLAPEAGTVAVLRVAAGDQVEADALLVQVDAEPSS